VTIASEGNATDFGDLVDDANINATGVSNTTIGLFTGSGSNTGDNGAKIDAITIASTGNATDFGDRSIAAYNVGAVSNSTRGVFAQWSDSVSNNVMDYITIASTGNATDFGDQIGLHTNGYGDSNGHGGI